MVNKNVEGRGPGWISMLLTPALGIVAVTVLKKYLH